jgi:hypothetical protein
MKKWLFAGVLFLGVWFLDLQIERESSQPPVRPVVASLTGRKAPTDAEHRLALLSNKLKGCTCVLPRPTSCQGIHHIASKRTLRGLEKILQPFKVREIISDCQIVNLFILP